MLETFWSEIIIPSYEQAISLATKATLLKHAHLLLSCLDAVSFADVGLPHDILIKIKKNLAILLLSQPEQGLASVSPGLLAPSG